ncbi:YteA family regulatory protein [Bacillus mesophilus]|uniref:YteA family sporulation protein n=1 Tax=Bacillus mesophilus TaxID=1808955 RepID=A0A6M0Q6R9_9BACI|nr:yteA family sporulation protein [Bacillus mesophilus]MBM7660424.1 YteA family regulatory protein [Bacillus mesophilus]NEY72024.1 yteA family sporulation protein [Bacillus mesophilus]
MISALQIDKFKQHLLSDKQAIENRFEKVGHYDLERGAIHESMGELSSYDNHPADDATELFEREKDIALNEHTEKELKDITHALQAIEEGSYGVCKECGKEIPVERLEALPTALYCKEHSPEQLESHERPVEEDILMPAFGRFEYDESEGTAFDAEDSWQEVARYGTSETPSDIDMEVEHYNDAYVESEDPVGYVEDYENFIGTDIEGKNITVYPNHQHKSYEDLLDEAGTMTIFGDLPAGEKEPYTEEGQDYYR